MIGGGAHVVNEATSHYAPSAILCSTAPGVQRYLVQLSFGVISMAVGNFRTCDNGGKFRQISNLRRMIFTVRLWAL